MVIGGGFVLESEWYWRIYEGNARFEDEPGRTAARDFLWPLAGLAKGLAGEAGGAGGLNNQRFELDDIAVDPDGDVVRFRLANQAVEIGCRGLRIDQFVAAINERLAAAELDLKFAIVESRRYELRGVLIARDEAVRCRVARGTPPPMLRPTTQRDD